jgi:hypothetical protein
MIIANGGNVCIADMAEDKMEVCSSTLLCASSPGTESHPRLTPLDAWFRALRRCSIIERRPGAIVVHAF